MFKNNSVNFSLWCDFLQRDFINNEFKELIFSNIINGATSNPTIFKNAFCDSRDYEDAIKSCKFKHPKTLYEILATQDIRLAAEKLLKNYVNDDDGFVSLEVDPNLYDDAQGSLKEGKNLYSTIGMPNVMIKIPATKAGFEAMNELMKKGINVNATLVFSPNQAQDCLDAFENATNDFIKRFPKARLPKAVISVFVSRFDRLLDEKMLQKSLPTSQIGIMNASKIYNIIQKRNLSNVKTLFASTGVKGDNLHKAHYVKELLYKNSINTAPLDTIKSFENINFEEKKPLSDESIDKFFDIVKKANIDMNVVYRDLLSDGISSFLKSFEEIMSSLKKKI